MNRFTVEETNLLSIYHEGSKAQLIENMTAALPYMDAGLRELAKRTLSKVDALTDAERRQVEAIGRRVETVDRQLDECAKERRLDGEFAAPVTRGLRV